MKTTFIVLHYKSYRSTIKCINSINSLKGEKRIVIVDNNSQDGSLEIIKDNFKTKKNLWYIHNKENLGFAAGNNVGYEYARKTFDSDLIVICNNDIIFDKSDFLMDLYSDYKRTHFDVAGPDIESLKNGKHQNPLNQPILSNAKIEIEICKYKILYFLSKMNIYDFLRGKFSPSKKNTGTKACFNESRNVMLHGSIIIFSRNFIEKEKYAFRPGTFLYLEENILFEYCQFKKYATFYFPDLHVFHEEDVSTNQAVENAKAKRELIFTNMINSFKVLKRQRSKYGAR